MLANSEARADVFRTVRLKGSLDMLRRMCRTVLIEARMPRPPRSRCEGDIYHAMELGAGRQVIFEDNADRRSFVDLLEKNVNRGMLRDGDLAWP